MLPQGLWEAAHTRVLPVTAASASAAAAAVESLGPTGLTTALQWAPLDLIFTRNLVVKLEGSSFLRATEDPEQVQGNETDVN